MHHNLSRLFVLLIFLLLPVISVQAHGGEEEEPAATEITDTTQADDDHSEDGIATDDHHGAPAYWIVAVSVFGGAILALGSLAIFNEQYPSTHYGIIGLIAVTGIIHLIYGLQGSTLLILNGVGYLGLAGMRFLPLARKRPYSIVLDGIIVVYTVATIIAYFLTHSAIDPVGGITKGIEVLLILILGFSILRQPDTVLSE